MLIGKNIKLRQLIKSDINFLYTIENDFKNYEYGHEHRDFTKQEIAEFISNSSLQNIHTHKQLRMIVTFKNIPIGILDLFNLNNSKGDLGIFIEKKYRMNGYGQESLNIFKEFCQLKLKIRTLYCKIKSNNIKSIKLFKSVGFKEKSMLNQYKYFKIDL